MIEFFGWELIFLFMIFLYISFCDFRILIFERKLEFKDI